MRFPLSRMISNTNLFSPRFTMSRAMTSSSIFTLWTVTRSGGCSLVVSKFYLPFVSIVTGRNIGSMIIARCLRHGTFCADPVPPICLLNNRQFQTRGLVSLAASQEARRKNRVKNAGS